MGERIRRYLFAFSEILLLTTFFIVFIGQTFVIEGHSMEPTILNGQKVFAEKLSLLFTTPQFGDIIVFKNPLDPSQYLIKRVVGVGGDELIISNGVVYVNGTKLNEKYAKEPISYPQYVRIRIPEAHYYVLGDNRNRSSDSRFLGVVPKENIVGRSLFTFWPVKSMKVFAKKYN